jgi:hypothetical protein
VGSETVTSSTNYDTKLAREKHNESSSALIATKKMVFTTVTSCIKNTFEASQKNQLI